MALQTSKAPSSTSAANPHSTTNANTHAVTIPIIAAFLISGLLFVVLIVLAIWRRIKHGAVLPNRRRWRPRLANTQDVVPPSPASPVKPVLWDVWTLPRQEQPSWDGDCEKADWEKILPVAINPTETDTLPPHDAKSISSIPSSLSLPNSGRPLGKCSTWFTRHSTSSLNTSAAPSIAPPPPVYLDASVIIVLPDPRRKYYNPSMNSLPKSVRAERRPSFEYALGVAQVAMAA